MRKFYTLLFGGMILILSSCTSIKVSNLSNYNKIENDDGRRYKNDSLDISISFLGGHTYQPLTKPKIKIPNYNRNLLRKLSIPSPKIIYHSKSTLTNKGVDFFGFNYFGYITNKLDLETISKKLHRDLNLFYSDVYRFSDKIVIVYLIPLKENNVLFICSKKLTKNLDVDSLILINNTRREFYSSVISLNK